MGDLSVRDWGTEYGNGGWNSFEEARGAVTIPAGQEVFLELGPGGVADMSPLASLGAQDLQGISIFGTNVTDADMANFAGMTGIREARLSGTGIGDEGLSHLSDNHGMQYINLHSTAVTDAGMAHLQNMTDMRRLTLNRTGIGDEGFQYLSGMNELVTLDNWLGNVTNEGMAVVAELESLRELGLESNLVTDEGLQHLRDHPELTRLNLQSNAITDAGLEHLVAMPELAEVSLRNTYITDAGVAILLSDDSLRAMILPITLSPEAVKRLQEAGLQIVDYKGSDSIPCTLRVIDAATGGPVPNARFETVVAAQIWLARTDVSGVLPLWLPVADGSEIEYIVRADGYVSESRTSTISADQPLLVRLQAGVAVGGTVVDESRAAIPGASVILPMIGERDWYGPDEMSSMNMTTVVSDDNGVWQAPVFPASGDFEIAIKHPSYQTGLFGPEQFSLSDLRSGRAEFVLRRAVQLRGRVIDEFGAPIIGARVYTEASTYPRRIGADTRSAEDGAFLLEPLQSGLSLINVQAPSFEPTAINVEVGSEENLVVVLKPLGPIRGRVMNLAGEPVPNADVRMQSTSSNLDFNGKSDALGQFEWLDAPETPLRVFVSAPGHFRTRDDVQHPGEDLLTLKLVEAPDIAGVLTVQDGETLPADLRVFATFAGSTADTSRTTRRRSDNFQRNGQEFAVNLGDVYPEYVSPDQAVDGVEVRIVAEAAGYLGAVSPAFDIKDGSQYFVLNIKRAPKSVALVIHTPEGMPAAKAIVTSTSQDNPATLWHDKFPEKPSDYITASDDSGAAELELDPTATHVLAVHETGFAVADIREIVGSRSMTLEPFIPITVEASDGAETNNFGLSFPWRWLFAAPLARSANGRVEVGEEKVVMVTSESDMQPFRSVRFAYFEEDRSETTLFAVPMQATALMSRVYVQHVDNSGVEAEFGPPVVLVAADRLDANQDHSFVTFFAPDRPLPIKLLPAQE